MAYEHKVFNPYMCFICQMTAKDVELKRCSSCKLISYCSVSHQRRHWKYHKDFCKVIRKVKGMSSLSNLAKNEDWFKYHSNLMILCESNLGRQLTLPETNMVLFQSSCQICHKTTDLEVCSNCLSVSYCSDDHKNADFNCHSSVCNSFSLLNKIELYQEKNYFIPNYSISTRQGDIKLMDDISSFITSYVSMKRNSGYTDVEEALLSEILTCPLSLLYVLNRLNKSLGTHAVIHLVGSGILEFHSLLSWDIILYIHKELKNLMIHLIGPDVRNFTCEVKSLHKGRLKFKYSDKFYHDFCIEDTYKKPDVICAFNCGFHDSESSQTKTWKKSIPFFIQDENTLFFFTSYNKDEASQDSRMILNVRNNIEPRMEPHLNPFSSLRPYRDPETLGIFFNNMYLCTV